MGKEFRSYRSSELGEHSLHSRTAIFLELVSGEPLNAGLLNSCNS